MFNSSSDFMSAMAGEMEEIALLETSRRVRGSRVSTVDEDGNRVRL